MVLSLGLIGAPGGDSPVDDPEEGAGVLVFSGDKSVNTEKDTTNPQISFHNSFL